MQTLKSLLYERFLGRLESPLLLRRSHILDAQNVKLKFLLAHIF